MISDELKSIETTMTRYAETGATEAQALALAERMKAVREMAEKWEASARPARRARAKASA